MRRLLIVLVCCSFQIGTQVSALAQCTGTAFHVLPAFPVVQEPTAAAYGDFNNDRIKDIAISSNHSNAVGILLGRPSGGFGPIRLIPVQFGPLSIVVGNFDQDSNQDLAVINFLGGPGLRGSVSVLMGNGQGDFTLRAHLPTGPKPISLAPLDVNNDRNLDLAVVSYAANEVLILKGDGTGNFPTRVVIPTNDMPRQIEVGHFNGDNRIDLAVLHDS